MKQLSIAVAISILTISTSTFANHGFYAGVGGAASSVSESYRSTLFSSDNRSGLDTYDTSANNINPVIQAGYWAPFATNWLWGVSATWKYLGYQTTNVNGPHGQYIPNASFSSINFFGADVNRDFSSQTSVSNEVLLMVYLGMQLQQGYVYLGVGPAWFTASNSIYMWSVHIPNATGDHLISTSTSSNSNVLGGGAQVGYNYFLAPGWFVNISYTYLQSTTGNFKNTVNAATFNGANTASATTLYFNRSINWSTQEVMFSINKML